MSRRTTDFQSIRSEGGLLPADLLRRIIDPKSKLEGLRPDDYGLPAGERLNEVITQSWNRLRKHWTEFRAAAENLPEGEPGTGLTNDKWNLPLLRELGFGPLPTTAGPEIAGRTYAINRFCGPVPIHLIGCGLSLDRRAAGVRGAAAGNPHGLVQEFLNRSSGHVWAIVSNGFRLRILRDNQALSRQSFLEFDLETLFTGELYSDFVLLWLLAHATRFAPQDGDKPESCWLERWTKLAQEEGTRALTDLRGGVEKALQVLGQGFVSHPKNTALREALRSRQVRLSDFHGQLLRVVYRLIFLFVAEDRSLEGIPLLHPQDKSEQARNARERYAAHYSSSRLRDLASKIKGSRHGDLWRQFQLIVGALSGDEQFAPMREALALPPLGSMLWNPTSTALLNGPGLAAPGAELTNFDFLEALRLLAFTRQGKVLRPVDYKNLGSEEFGGVYESFLALTPQISSDGARFTFAEFAGNERKTSGSYYTPDSLVQCLLDSALDPVVEEKIKGKDGLEAERALLSLKVCDKAVGSGHFLVGAAHRLARHLARIRAVAMGESEPSPLLYQTALRDVIGHCLYGVDINPMAVELCKVTLWLEALEPGKPLSFLDHHIRCGNSLLGATPDLIAAGLPDEAFDPIEGDDKAACSSLKKLNRAEREGLRHLFIAEDNAIRDRLRQAAAAIDEMGDSRPEDIQRKEAAFRAEQSDSDFQKAWELANLWCAAFVIQKRFADPPPAEAGEGCRRPNEGREEEPPTLDAQPPATQGSLFGATEELPSTKGKKAKAPHGADSENAVGITTQRLRDFVENGTLPEGLRSEARRLADQYQFFHWHLAFPEVLAKGGFDLNLGNPPWDMQEVKDNEFFAGTFPEILSVKSAKDKAGVLARIRASEPGLWQAYQEYVRVTYGQRHFMAKSGRFPLAATGRMNLYRLFLETGHTFVGPTGRVGIVLPSGFASDSFSQDHFADLHGGGRIVSLYDFENRLGIFPGVHSSYRFCLLTIGGQGVAAETDFVFFAHKVSDLADVDRHVRLSQQAVSALNPLSRTAPLFRSCLDYALTLRLQKAGPIIGRNETDGAWSIKPTLMFMMNADMKGHRTAEELEAAGCQPIGNRYVKAQEVWLPFYEGKMVGMYDHRAASIRFDPANRVRRNQPVALSEAEHENPDQLAMPMFWLNSAGVAERCEGLPKWCLAVKDVTSATNERTSIAAMLPNVALTDSLPWLASQQDARMTACLLANLNCHCFDYVARQKVAGLHLRGHYLAQLPIISLRALQGACSWTAGAELVSTWLLPRVLELTYTAWDLEPFAQECVWSCPPFRWDEDRRFLLRCELDAAFFHLYLGTEDEWRQQPAALTQSFPTPRDAVAYMMDTFPIVKRKDEAAYGVYRTKDTILEIYDSLQNSIRTGAPYQTRLDPPPADPRCCHPKRKLAILAFGSLRNDPGNIGEHIVFRIKTETPFPVEYGRLSTSRGGGPTLVPHDRGAKVEAELLVLPDDMALEDARNLLWLRERRREASGEKYSRGTGPNHVLVREWNSKSEWGDCPWVEQVLYTDFNPSGKVTLTAEALAKAAIESVPNAPAGKDGITYFLQAEQAGIETPLTKPYHDQILKQTKAKTLQEALEDLKKS